VVRFLEWDGHGNFQAAKAEWAHRPATILEEIPVAALRFRRSIVMPIEPVEESARRRPDPSLISLIKEARKAQNLVETNRMDSLQVLSAKAGRQPGYFARLLRLNYLAPDIITAILDGTQPSTLCRKRLIKANLPTNWAIQRAMFGFDPRPDHSLRHSARYERPSRDAQA